MKLKKTIWKRNAVTKYGLKDVKTVSHDFLGIKWKVVTTWHRPYMITNEALTEMLGKKVYWHELVAPMTVRVHFDQERYLGEHKDVSVLKINKYMEGDES